jgi:hypothetical protein
MNFTKIRLLLFPEQENILMDVVIMFMKHESIKYMRHLKQMINIKEIEPAHGFYHTHTA